MYNDASDIGFGGYIGNQYFSGVWPKAWEAYHITVKEFTFLQYTASSYFVHVLMKSMYLLAFHCFLMIGEFTAPIDKNCHLLSVQSVFC